MASTFVLALRKALTYPQGKELSRQGGRAGKRDASVQDTAGSPPRRRA
jgi:hypothetical protein